MTIIDMRSRPAFLHPFFGGVLESPQNYTACWLNQRVGTRTALNHFEASTTLSGFEAEIKNAGITTAVVVGRHTPTQHIANDDVAALVRQSSLIEGIGRSIHYCWELNQPSQKLIARFSRLVCAELISNRDLPNLLATQTMPSLPHLRTSSSQTHSVIFNEWANHTQSALQRPSRPRASCARFSCANYRGVSRLLAARTRGFRYCIFISKCSPSP